MEALVYNTLKPNNFPDSTMITKRLIVKAFIALSFEILSFNMVGINLKIVYEACRVLVLIGQITT